MHSHVAYGNIYGNWNKIRCQQFANTLVSNGFRATYVSTKFTAPRGGLTTQLAHHTSAAHLTTAHDPAGEAIPSEPPCESARQSRPFLGASAGNVIWKSAAQSEPSWVRQSQPSLEPSAGSAIWKSATEPEPPCARPSQPPLALSGNGLWKSPTQSASPSAATHNYRRQPVSSIKLKFLRPSSFEATHNNRAQLVSPIKLKYLRPSSFKATHDHRGQTVSSIKLKSRPSSPSQIINAWKTGSLNSISEEQLKLWFKTDTSTSIFLRYLKFLESPDIPQLSKATPTQLEQQLRPSENFFTESIKLSLHNFSCNPEDVRNWAWVIHAPDGDAAVFRLFQGSCTSTTPVAILNEILRSNHMRVWNLRKLITHIANQLSSLSTSQNKMERGILEEKSFRIVVSGLLKHARIADSPSMMSIARLVSSYCDIMTSSAEEERLSEKAHGIVSNICRYTIQRLSMPSDRTPFESMEHACEAQHMILEAGNSLRPALELDAKTYRAIAVVLLGSKKTSDEVESLMHLRRSWPPWKMPVDGMDAQRLPGDETTRVVRVLQAMKAAGYAPTSFDKYLSILGGRDTDGTPTIPTRTILGRYPIDKKSLGNPWAARIRATRNAQEAWGAFQAYDGVPSQAMFHEMFEKLIYENIGDRRGRMHEPTPGDGREVPNVENDNLTEFEIQRRAPPKIKDLYATMKSTHHRLARRTLLPLLESANSFGWARQLLLDSNIPEDVVRALTRRYPYTDLSPFHLDHNQKQQEEAQEVQRLQKQYLHAIPEEVLVAYLKLTTRFSRHPLLNPLIHGGRTSGSDYLIDAVHLLQSHPSPSPAGWHTVMRAISAPKFCKPPDPSSTTDPEPRKYNHSEAPYWWGVLYYAIKHPSFTGHIIDPDTFQYTCYGLYSAIFASDQGHIFRPSLQVKGLSLVKSMWESISNVEDEELGLMHKVRGSHIHAYIRLMAIAGEHREFVHTMAWMQKWQHQLDAVAQRRANGAAGLRKAIVAMRLLAVPSNDSENNRNRRRLKALEKFADQITCNWGGWPTDEEVEDYKNHVESYEEGFDEKEWLIGKSISRSYNKHDRFGVEFSTAEWIISRAPGVSFAPASRAEVGDY